MINLLCSTLFVILWGLNGVIVGMMIANLFRTCQYAIFASKHVINRSLWSFIKNILWHVGNTAVIVLLYNTALRSIVIDGWETWIFKAGLCFAMALLVTVASAAIFYHGELKRAWAFLLRAIRKKKKA